MAATAFAWRVFATNFDEEEGPFFETELWEKSDVVNAQIYMFLKEENFQLYGKRSLFLCKVSWKTGSSWTIALRKALHHSQKFTDSEDEIGEVHMSLGPEMEVRELPNQYDDIKESKIDKKNPKHLLKGTCCCIMR